ncbi:glutamine-dependent NAD(+) synthetase with GAT domain-containing protein [Calocera viscosa TUFC12733]|uniref:Glutamine-dependent NAD(+) synthetase n=1 Tax=Calocera viscosa (strain TUFC12733) TaxID=1330018 RepID=A0A167FZC7_CALVF|nr:glutamine-dependent NAD(+) synthetase with GAT domain-containing protein [Calocera viscosa TUFC12733]
MGHHITDCPHSSLNQWALDFRAHPKSKTMSASLWVIMITKERGASLRVRPELEIPGCGCLDHLLRGDTLLTSAVTNDILCDVGMSVVHKDANCNCRVTTVPFGDAVLSTYGTYVGIQLFGELFTPASLYSDMGLDDVEISTNSSGSHHELRKLYTRIDLIKEGTEKFAGIYLYENQQGCVGDRFDDDGCAMIAVNGKIIPQGSQSSLNDLEVTTAAIDIDEMKPYTKRGSRIQKAAGSREPEVSENRGPDRCVPTGYEHVGPWQPYEIRYHLPEEEIGLGPACWLWDYLRRFRIQGCFVSLSGGIHSCSTSMIVYTAGHGDKQVIVRAPRILWEPDNPSYNTSHPVEFCKRIFPTCMEIRKRARDPAVPNLFGLVTDIKLQFKVHGGSLHMVLACMFARLMPFVRGRAGRLVVRGSANVDESLRGYLTMYDCSSADINTIGAISNTDLKEFRRYAQIAFDLPILESFLDAAPSAELEPITETYLRNVEHLSPYMVYMNLMREWGDHFSPTRIAEKVKLFFVEQARNRHGMNSLTPSHHAESYSPDDNRFDLGPFVYPSRFPFQFTKIDKTAAKLLDRSANPGPEKAKVE